MLARCRLDIDAGLALLKQNTAGTPYTWIGYHAVMALGCYLKGELTTAAAQSRQIANPFFPPGLVLDAAIAYRAGDLARAQQDIAMLDQFYPAWRKNVRAAVVRFLPNPAVADRITRDFAAAAEAAPE